MINRIRLIGLAFVAILILVLVAAMLYYRAEASSLGKEAEASAERLKTVSEQLSALQVDYAATLAILGQREVEKAAALDKYTKASRALARLRVTDVRVRDWASVPLPVAVRELFKSTSLQEGAAP